MTQLLVSDTPKSATPTVVTDPLQGQVKPMWFFCRKTIRSLEGGPRHGTRMSLTVSRFAPVLTQNPKTLT